MVSISLLPTRNEIEMKGNLELVLVFWFLQGGLKKSLGGDQSGVSTDVKTTRR